MRYQTTRSALGGYRRPPVRRIGGMGFAPAASGVFQAASMGPAPIASVASIASGTAFIPTWFIPFIGPAIAAVTFGISKLFNNIRGQQKVAATKIVEQASQAMAENLAAFESGPHTVSSQEQALKNFDAIWRFVVEGCGKSELAEAGQRCISERQRGSTATCWINGVQRSCDFFAAFRDPIANAQVTADPPLAAAGQLLTGDGGMGPLIGLAAVGALLYAVNS